MDLLIELIVWIFKALLGEDEKTKRRQQDARGRTNMPPQRGPYDYGDNRQAAPGIANRPRTLEEILEEVKRQQQQSQNRPAARPPQAQQPQQRKQPQPQARPAIAQAAPAVGNSLDQVSDRHMLSKLDARTLQTKMEEREIVKPQTIEKNFDKLKTREKERFRPLSEESPMGAAAETAAYSDAFTVVAQRKDNYIEMFKTLRNSPPQTRVELARRAFVFAEIFGPPRSRRLMQHTGRRD